jgi:uncharacterized protein YdaU (DUF1376 family)
LSLPYFPMFPSDFEAKTSHLTLEEDGAYNRLLRLCWMTPGCSLPDDAAWISRRMRVDAATFERVVAPLLDEFFRREKGRVYQPKLMLIHHDANAKHERRVDAGKKGGRPAKSLKEKEKAQSNALALPKQPEPEPELKVSVSKDTGAVAPIDPAKVVFDAGVKVLSSAGKSPSAARSIVGKWRGQHGDEAVIAALGKAQREGAVDPVAFCEGVFRQSAKSNGKAARRQLPDGRWQSYDQFNGCVDEHF